MTTVAHSCFTSIEESWDDDCIVNMDYVFLEIIMNKDILKQFSKGGTCVPDPVLVLHINVHSLREVATEVGKMFELKHQMWRKSDLDNESDG